MNFVKKIKLEEDVKVTAELFHFDLQRFARDSQDVTNRGRRRWNGNHGRVWWDGELLFEISKFECKVTANREDVIIGNSLDSKVVGLKGEGSFTIKMVINRNINKYLEEWKAGHDPRATVCPTGVGMNRRYRPNPERI